MTRSSTFLSRSCSAMNPGARDNLSCSGCAREVVCPCSPSGQPERWGGRRGVTWGCRGSPKALLSRTSYSTSAAVEGWTSFSALVPPCSLPLPSSADVGQVTTAWTRTCSTFSGNIRMARSIASSRSSLHYGSLVDGLTPWAGNGARSQGLYLYSWKAANVR
eukprot:755738-Hanusia_phi.AAC.8